MLGPPSQHPSLHHDDEALQTVKQGDQHQGPGKQFGPCSQNRFGRLAALDSASIVGVMTRLRARKFVTIKKEPIDKRRIVIDLTAEGRKVTLKAMALGREANDQTLASLNVTQRSQLLELLALMAPTEPRDEIGS
ncbi:MAG: MarR family transcriptional regulator, lower aerobic nicotinate degradation pathway regulator [Thermoanaerobaculia bacterium]|jgi:DNA-binding MarR family transcriptional regulator|nr:MarR family transcriptional regulator, lower aerobic nicotinate degradation pathway regulator [Thermoanaerobaculia bacterium]